MAEANITFGKIVSFPKPLSWSQAYSAGKLFAVLSLKSEGPKEQEDPELLSHVGRGVLDRLEEEFFTIEAKNLSSIKRAVESALEKLPEGVISSFGAAVFNNNVLYLFAVGGSKVFIKRNGKFGTILDSEDLGPKSIASSSGLLQDNDLIILSTKSFLDIVDPSFLSSSLDNLSPSEIAEALTPKVHEKEEGGASAFIAKYTKQDQTPKKLSNPENIQKTEGRKEPTFPIKDSLPVKLSHSKKVYLTVVVVILIILSSSIFFAVKKQNDSRSQELFKDIYPSALKKYEEGNSLLGLNANLAKENLLASKELLEDNKNKFTENSKEQEEILTLLEKVNDGLEILDQNISFFLKTQIDNPKASFFAQDEKFVYILDSDGVSSIDKKNGQKKLLVKSDSWKTAGGVEVYLENLYILDKGSNQILKFVEEGDSFTKSNYFSGPPNLSNAVDLAIDGSIWILLKDGTIQKFIRGTKDQFSISGLDKPFKSPAKIFTERDIESLYVLDNGNSRVVVIGKDGKYLSEYSLDVIKNAKGFEVLEKDKKILVLSQNKIYEIKIK